MQKKERLIPREKSKKVIYLDKRGYSGNKKICLAIIFGILMLISMIYCLSIAFFMGYGTKFFLVWGVLGIFFGFLMWLMLRPDILEKIPMWIKWSFIVICIIGVMVFATVEGMILDRFGSVPAPGADYCIILGAQWKEHGPSYVLQKRLDAAVGYLEQNEGTKVIVSGGQGSNEPITEAEGMKQYLIAKGIEENRIICEEKSTNTYENLANSSAYLDIKSDRVVLVTNNFHVFRACGIARKYGYEHLEGLSAGSYPAMLPNNLLREFLGVIKDTYVGNL